MLYKLFHWIIEQWFYLLTRYPNRNTMKCASHVHQWRIAIISDTIIVIHAYRIYRIVVHNEVLYGVSHWYTVGVPDLLHKFIRARHV
jgi:hypothetical protein